jgi:hypothetical protein
MKRQSIEKFIEKSNIIHNHKYDYSNVIYKNNYTKIEIKCLIHGLFFQMPTDHLGGHGCPICGGTEQSTTNQFIEKAQKVHGNKYDYSNVVYLNAFSKVEIKCPLHGIFLQKPNSHLNGCRCPYCFGTPKLTTSQFIEKAQKVHGNKYDYSNVVYLSTHEKVKIICKIHGEFSQTPASHLQGTGCNVCSRNKRYTINSFINESNIIHNKKYDYSFITEYKDNKSKVCIKCPKHGKFLQRPDGHLLGQGCPHCNSSYGEIKILNFLKNNNIEFISQKTFVDCINPKSNTKLKFDFYLPNQNILIEYDGEQHYKMGALIKGKHLTTEHEFKEIQFRDKLRNEYSKNNNIKLLRIKYTKFNQIEQILTTNLL